MKIPVAILGATGMVGQRFVSLLAHHPWFEVVALAASERSEGKRYGETVHWLLPDPLPPKLAEMRILSPDPEQLAEAKLVFSALPAEEARQIEPHFARAGKVVCSNASAFRMEPDIPLLMPEVNPDHIALIEIQRKNRGWQGAILTNPNCTSSGLTVALKALDTAFGVQRAFVVSLQALSGAGYPGVASLDILDNLIPYIPGEESKVETEPRKMLGQLSQGKVVEAPLRLSAHTNRVPVLEGHTVCASVELEQPADVESAAAVLENYQAPSLARDLPSAPRPIILLRREPDRPQPRLDRMSGHGMTTVVGRLRPDPLFHLKFVVLSHNTLRGAAGGSIYNAELYARYVGWK
ncbi:MAG: aspartate-semialdehyde dehydrogenase [Anaerolineales bacterium]|nr:aspartate-semialdehyde dehydrogenase [Anaerolineales bacterium]MDW8227608.1 aspartate-semialdehyde dehydrogenase [Anaerolineales bacterium]